VRRRRQAPDWLLLLQIVIPAPKKKGQGDALIAIKALPDWAQPAFAGMATLNTIQSKVCDIALNSAHNLLMCAPTGAGKTNVAVLAILHAIGAALQPDGSIAKDKFKVVYVAPMKALVAEMVGNFQKRLDGPYGIKTKELTGACGCVSRCCGRVGCSTSVRMCMRVHAGQAMATAHCLRGVWRTLHASTLQPHRIAQLGIFARAGDIGLSKAEIEEAQIIVTTPEKWDVITRKSGERAFTQLVKLIIIDEVHLLHDDRGPVLESIIARCATAFPPAQPVLLECCVHLQGHTAVDDDRSCSAAHAVAAAAPHVCVFPGPWHYGLHTPPRSVCKCNQVRRVQDAAAGRGDRRACAHGRPLGHAAELRGRRDAAARQQGEGPLLLQRELPAVPARADVYRCHDQEAAAAFPADERDRVQQDPRRRRQAPGALPACLAAHRAGLETAV
jgi:DEAD/DEAH box helicase